MPVENRLTSAAHAFGKADSRVKGTITIDIPTDTIANARNALQCVVLVATGALSALDAGVAKYGDAEVLRGIGQLLSALSRSMVVKNLYFLLAIPILHIHSTGYYGSCLTTLCGGLT